MAHSFLAIYLRDHHAASRAGARLARRVAQLDGELHGVGDEVEDDMRSLRRVMARLGVRPDPVKDVLAVAAERLSRLKRNGRAIRRSPLSDVLELETLVVGITGKRALWTSLREAEVAPREEVDGLVARADDQISRVEAARLRAARRALARPD